MPNDFILDESLGRATELSHTDVLIVQGLFWSQSLELNLKY